MTQIEYDNQMRAIKAEEQVAVRRDEEIINKCDLEIQEKWLQVAEIKTEINRLQLMKKEAFENRARLLRDFKAMKTELAKLHPVSSMEDSKVSDAVIAKLNERIDAQDSLIKNLMSQLQAVQGANQPDDTQTEEAPSEEKISVDQQEEKPLPEPKGAPYGLPEVKKGDGVCNSKESKPGKGSSNTKATHCTVNTPDGEETSYDSFSAACEYISSKLNGKPSGASIRAKFNSQRRNGEPEEIYGYKLVRG